MRGREELDSYEWCYGVPLQVGNHVRIDPQLRDYDTTIIYRVVAILYSKDADQVRVALRKDWDSKEAYISVFARYLRPADDTGFTNASKMLYAIVDNLITNTGGTP